MEDADTQFLRKKFGPKGGDYVWNKMAMEVAKVVGGVVDKQPKHNTNMVASNAASARADKPAVRTHSSERKPHIVWSPVEKEQILKQVEERMRFMRMEVPDEGKAHTYQNSAYIGLFRASQEALLDKARWRTFLTRNHIEQSGFSQELRKRLKQPAQPPEAAAIAELAQAMDSAAPVIHAPIQDGKTLEAAAQTTTGKEVRVISVDPDAKQRKKKVWWKSHEVQGVQTLAINKMKSLGVGTLPTKDDYSGSRMLLEVFNSAQHQMLPKDRWKILKSRTQLESCGLLDNLQNLLRQAPKQAPVETASVPPPNATPSQVPVAPAAQGPGPVSPALAETEPAQLRPSALPGNEIMAALSVIGRAITDGQTFAKQVGELTEMNTLLMDEIDGLRKRIEVLDTAMRGMVKEERKVAGHEKAALPVVAVLGCRKDEFDQIVARATERGLKLEYRHYDQDTKPRPINADWAIAMKFINHAWNDHIKDCIQRGQYTFVRGGIGQMVMQLEVWFGGASV